MLNAISADCQILLASLIANVAYMETFKQRMKRIRIRAGFESQAAAAAAIGCERGTVGMWEAPSSNVASVGDWLLQAASVYKVRPEWINDLRSTVDGFPWHADSAGATQSQSPPLRLDPEMLAESIAALRQVAKRRGWAYDPEIHADATCFAYEMRMLLPEAPTTANVIDFGERVADRLRLAMEGGNGTSKSGAGAVSGADDRGQPGQEGKRRTRAAGGAQ